MAKKNKKKDNGESLSVVKKITLRNAPRGMKELRELGMFHTRLLVESLGLLQDEAGKMAFAKMQTDQKAELLAESLLVYDRAAAALEAMGPSGRAAMRTLFRIADESNIPLRVLLSAVRD